MYNADKISNINNILRISLGLQDVTNRTPQYPPNALPVPITKPYNQSIC